MKPKVKVNWRRLGLFLLFSVAGATVFATVCALTHFRSPWWLSALIGGLMGQVGLWLVGGTWLERNQP